MTRVHLLSLPHMQTTKDDAHEGFIAKTLSLATMLTAQGHHVIVYSGEENDAPCAEHVAVHTEADRQRWFNGEPYDNWVVGDPCWIEMAAATVDAIRERAEPHDIINLTAGIAHQPVADALPHLMAVELGIGYERSCARYRAFESRAWQHFIYGRDGNTDPSHYDTVIPCAFDTADFTFRAGHDDYLLFLGRHTPRKGLAVIEELAKSYDVITAGHGDPIPGTTHLGHVSVKERADLLAGARCLLAPTSFVEPFGRVAVEAQLSGTPVLASPFGAFAETVQEGVTGFLPHTLGETLAAVEACHDLNRQVIRQRALDLYSLDAVAPQYDAYLNRLDTLWGDGWYTKGAA